MLKQALLVVMVAAALPAQAQLINRDKSADKPAADDDDDILAPVKDPKAKDKIAPAEPAKAKAFKVGIVGIVPVGEAGKPLADQVTAGVLKELNEGAVFDAVPLAVDVKAAGSGGGSDEAAAKQALADGTALLDKGRGFVEKLNFGKAKKAYELALEALEKAAPVLADPTLLIDARVGLAEVAARQGQESEAEVQLAYAAVLNPELELDKKRYPPQFVRTHQKMRDKMLKEDKATILVDASGAGAVVHIDGRPTAGAPVKITEVPPGRHVVRALREGLPSFGAVVEVKAGESITVSPGFIAKDGTSYVDDLQNNRFTPAMAKAVAEAAKAAGLKGAVVGVASKSSGSVPVQLVLVDANAGMLRLPLVSLEESLLDLSIEVLKAREAIEAAYEGDGKLDSAPIAVLIEGARAGAAVETATIALRYDVRAAKERPASRVVTDDKPKDADAAAEIDDDSRSVLSAGKSGTRKRMDDDDDPYANKDSKKDEVADPDAPLTEQGWFWPTVIGGGAGALALIAGGTYLTLVGADVLPDPRPASGAEIHVALPQ